jgi:outer membrane protein assembly factor BamB
VICSGHPIELDKPHILALAAETGFLLFKEQVPVKVKTRNISGSMQKEDLSIDITFNPC